MLKHKVVSRGQWLEARRAHLAEEKALTHQRDELARRRRELPWVKVDKQYVFDTPGGAKTLADLFGDKSQLIVYHFMFGPEWQEGCPSCSYLMDHVDGAIPHLAARDVSLVLVSRAPLSKLEPFKRRMGWHFNWVSSFGSDFNYDFQVTFTAKERATGAVYYNYTRAPFPGEEAPGLSVFYKDSSTGEVFHTYSVYARGLDPIVVTYTLLDFVPKGRDEDTLAFSMEWLRHHDRYATGGGFLDESLPFWPESARAAVAAATKSSNCPACAAAEQRT